MDLLLWKEGKIIFEISVLIAYLNRAQINGLDAGVKGDPNKESKIKIKASH